MIVTSHDEYLTSRVNLALEYADADTIAKRRTLMEAIDPKTYGPDASDEMVNAGYLGSIRYLLGDTARILRDVLAETDDL